MSSWRAARRADTSPPSTLPVRVGAHGWATPQRRGESVSSLNRLAEWFRDQTAVCG